MQKPSPWATWATVLIRLNLQQSLILNKACGDGRKEISLSTENTGIQTHFIIVAWTDDHLHWQAAAASEQETSAASGSSGWERQQRTVQLVQQSPAAARAERPEVPAGGTVLQVVFQDHLWLFQQSKDQTEIWSMKVQLFYFSSKL